MSYIYRDKFIYLAHPRTASVSTERGMATIYPKGIKTKPHHIGVPQIKKFYPKDTTGKEIICTTIRNPLDLIVSWYILTTSWSLRRTLLDFIQNYTSRYKKKA